MSNWTQFEQNFLRDLSKLHICKSSARKLSLQFIREHFKLENSIKMTPKRPFLLVHIFTR